MSIVIVKLGGAAITNKKGYRQLPDDIAALDAFLVQIKDAYVSLSKQGHRMILVHGAGSFGHPQARKYDLKVGWATLDAVSPGIPNPKVAKGMALVRSSVTELQSQLLTRFDSLDVPVVSIPPFEYVKTHGGIDDSAPSCFAALMDRTKELLDLGLVPMLNGDLVLDTLKGCTILSGDVIIYHLFISLPGVRRCVFVTDVDGIFADDPKRNPSTMLHRHIQVQEDKTIVDVAPLSSQGKALHKSDIEDVTGGMETKIKWAKNIVVAAKEKGVEVVICKSGSNEAGIAMAMKPVLVNGKPFPNHKLTVFTRE